MSQSKSQSAAAVKERSAVEGKSKPLPPFNVVLIDDNDHTYEYVIEMLKTVVGYDEQQGFVLAKAVDEQGRAIVYTAHRELAELKCEQIGRFGADVRIALCKGSMTAVVEEAPAA